MRLLLDTHSLLWFLTGATELTARAQALIENKENQRSTTDTCHSPSTEVDFNREHG